MENVGTWREQYPELQDFIEDEVSPAVDAYGATYVKAMDLADMEYGMEGVYMQLLYIASNLKTGYKDVEKRLVEWNKKIQKELGKL